MKSRVVALTVVAMAILVLAASCPNDDSPPAVNLSPVASFTRTPSSGDSPLEVDFDGSASSDPDDPPGVHRLRPAIAPVQISIAATSPLMQPPKRVSTTAGSKGMATCSG